VRAVLDTNVLIAALISRLGPSATLVLRWLDGEFDLVVSEQLLAELYRALAYPKLQARIRPAEASAFIELLRSTATMAADAEIAPPRSRDPGDDYLVALAESAAAVLVSGDLDLLALAPGLPVLSPADFLERLGAQ
jgi:putative PIN family toxin of toxin-antitoxin system